MATLAADGSPAPLCHGYRRRDHGEVGPRARGGLRTLKLPAGHATAALVCRGAAGGVAAGLAARTRSPRVVADRADGGGLRQLEPDPAIALDVVHAAEAIEVRRHVTIEDLGKDVALTSLAAVQEG